MAYWRWQKDIEPVMWHNRLMANLMLRGQTLDKGYDAYSAGG